MKSISDGLPKGRRRGAQATDKMAGAYRAVFSANGTKQDVEIVLSDLATFSGFYQVGAPDTADGARAWYDGQRSVFGHILRFLRMSETELHELEEAARMEAIVNLNEGMIE